MGLDAAVAYPTVTLKLKNPFDFPVVLHETLKDGIVRAEILGKRRSRDVTFVRKIADVVTVMHMGSLLAQGTIGEIEANPRVRDVYLGDPED